MYSLVTPNTNQHVTLYTKYTLEMVSVYYGSHLLFSTHGFLQRYGRSGVEQMSRQYTLRYGNLDKTFFSIGKKTYIVTKTE